MSALRPAQQLHLLYLSLIPSSGTLGIFFSLPEKTFAFLEFPVFWIPLFVFGLIAVALYLGPTTSYTTYTNGPLADLLLLFDTPVLAYLSTGGDLWQAMAVAWIIEAFIAVIALFALVLTSKKPTPEERRKSIAVTAIPALLVLFLAYWYFVVELAFGTKQLLFLAFSVVQGLVTAYALLDKDELARGAGDAAVYIIIGSLSWTAVFFFIFYAVIL